MMNLLLIVRYRAWDKKIRGGEKIKRLKDQG